METITELQGILLLSHIQGLIIEVTRKYGMVLSNLIPNTTRRCFIGVQFLAMGLFLFGFLLAFYSYKVPPDAMCLCVPTVTQVSRFPDTEHITGVALLLVCAHFQLVISFQV